MAVLGFEANKFSVPPKFYELARARRNRERRNVGDVATKLGGFRANFSHVAQSYALAWDKFFDKIPTPTQTGDSQSSR